VHYSLLNPPGTVTASEYLPGEKDAFATHGITQTVGTSTSADCSKCGYTFVDREGGRTYRNFDFRA
jgi:hypothetical protein